ncbi:MAG: LysR family transcriptional regulator [Xanthobacteraceae bacterium]|nr:LysR family transcriptional regulator [Xanthobacteraceae bacterium]
MMTVLDIPSVKAFLLVSELESFTRAAEALGTTQAAVSMKLQKLEALLGKRLVERSPRAVRLTADGTSFRDKARALVEAHDRALHGTTAPQQRLLLGVSDHAAGPQLVRIMERFTALSPSLMMSVAVGFSRDLLDTLDAGKLDAVIVRQEASRRGGETLGEDRFGWFAAPSFSWSAGTPLPLASLAAPCGVRTLALRALDKAHMPWIESFSGGGVSAVTAAVQAGLGVAALAHRIAPPGAIDVTARFGLPKLGPSKVMLYSKVSDASKLAALRTIAAAFRQAVT